MNSSETYPIGTPGQPWGAEERAAWFAAQSVKRSYADEVLSKLDALSEDWVVESYGALPHAPERYPLHAVRSRAWKREHPTVLVTGGVHGYETSGVQGALRFLETDAARYVDQFNFVVLPCISPWGYETINRWNPGAIDPNRSFRPQSPSPEAAAAMAYLASAGHEFIAHFDLHETTDTDNTEFRPALAARDAVTHEVWDIPDGFYGVGDSARPEAGFQRAIIESVEKVTHIAPGVDGAIIGEPLQQPGVINYDAGPLGLCMGLTPSRFVTTTEVYPDSPRATDEICTLAQVAALRGGLDYIVSLG
jgi:Succinylglutamate desuccinylase / Aspartoacylase family